MKFKLLLFILSNKLKQAEKKNPVFREFIKHKDVKVTMKTADGRMGRAFIIKDGTVKSSGDLADADAAFVWVDGNTAFDVMSAGDDEAFIAAMTEKKLIAEGDFKAFVWFLSALGKMAA